MGLLMTSSDISLSSSALNWYIERRMIINTKKINKVICELAIHLKGV